MMNLQGIKPKRSFFYLLIIFLIIGCTPILNKVYFFILLWIIILPYIGIENTLLTNNKNATIIYIPLLIFISIIILYKLLGISTASWGRYPALLLSFIPIILMQFLGLRLSLSNKILLIWIIAAVCLINVIDNIRLAYMYPFLTIDNVLREYKEFASKINWGGSVFFNIILLFSSISFVVFLNANRWKIKYFMLFCTLISSIYLFFFSLKASVIIYLIISLLFIYFGKKTKHYTVFFIFLFASTLLSYILIYMFEDAIIDIIHKYSPSSRISSRLIMLVNSDNEDASTSSFEAREHLWSISVKTWLDGPTNFLIGIGDHYTDKRAATTGIGQHSDFLDTLAQYGIIGSFFIFLALKNSFKYILSLFEKRLQLQIFPIIIIYVLCGFTKKCYLLGMSLMMFIYLPLISFLIVKKNKMKK